MAVAVIVVFTVAGTLYLQGNLADSTHKELREETDVVAAALNQASDDHVLLDQIELGDTRVTLVADDGTVLYDSDESPSDMANHADRPEIAEALADGDGISERSSSTMGETMLYNAVRLDDGSVIRLSKRQEGYISIFFTLLIPLFVPGCRCGAACMGGRQPRGQGDHRPAGAGRPRSSQAQYGKCLSGNGAHA